MNYKKIINEIKGIALTILGSIIIVAIVNTEVLASAKVQQESMENTLYNDEKLIVDKVSYNFTAPKREDIIIFLIMMKKEIYLKKDMNI